MRKKDLISDLLREAWGVPPARKAAEALHEVGIFSYDLWAWHKTKPARYIDDVWYNNTLNEMRDLETLAKLNTQYRNNYEKERKTSICKH